MPQPSRVDGQDEARTSRPGGPIREPICPCEPCGNLTSHEPPFVRGLLSLRGSSGDRTYPSAGASPLRDSAGISPDFAVRPAAPGCGQGNLEVTEPASSASSLIG